MISANRNDALPIPIGARLNIVKALNCTEIKTKVKREKKVKQKVKKGIIIAQRASEEYEMNMVSNVMK